MIDVFMESIGKVVIAIFGIIAFVLIIVLLPFAFMFMLLLECVIRALGWIIDNQSPKSKDDWNQGG